MAQGALDAAGVRRVGCELELGRSVRTAGGAGAFCVPMHTACFNSVEIFALYLPMSVSE